MLDFRRTRVGDVPLLKCRQRRGPCQCVDEQLAQVVKVETPEALPLCRRAEFGRAVLAGLIPVVAALTFVTTCGWFALVDDDGLCQYQPLLTEGLSARCSRASCRCGATIPVAAIRCSASGVLYPPHYLAHAICRLCGLPNREIAVRICCTWRPERQRLTSISARCGGHLAGLCRAVAYGMTGPMLGMATNWNEYCFLMAYVPLMFLGIEKTVAGDRPGSGPCSWV